MNVKQKIQEIRVKNEQRLKRKSERQNVASAKRLQRLKVQREKYEGKSRLKKYEASERKRIEVAKAEVRKESKINRIAGKLQGASSKVKKGRRKVASFSGGFVKTGRNASPSVDKGIFGGNVNKDVLNLKR